MTALSLIEVRKTFGSTIALESFDLAVEPGELVSLLGPSGCGKTTALRIVAGFEQPDRGTVTVNDRDVVDLPPNKRNMGMVFQAYSLFPNLTTAGNVAFGLRMRGVPAAERTKRVGDMLDLVGLSDRANRYPHQLSGGQQQRVALARALAIQPEVLLLDEPLSALDAKVRLQLRDEIRRIQRELGITTLFVTHDQEEALAISDRVAVMSNGRMEQLDAPRAVYDHPATTFVARFVGAMNEVPAVVVGDDAVNIGGYIVTGVDTRGASDGANVQLLVRPEHIGLGEPGSAPWSASVDAVAFHGPMSELAVRVNEPAIRLQVDLPTAVASTWTAGAPASVHFRPDSLLVDAGANGGAP